MSPERDSAEHRWPGYLLGGRIRTSTVVLLLAFIGIWWVYETYEPPPAPPDQIPATEVVPPGYVPDPAYTWVPRTYVQRPTTTTTPTTTPTTPTTPTTTGPETPTTTTPSGPETPMTTSEGPPSPGLPVPSTPETATAPPPASPAAPTPPQPAPRP